MIFIEGDLQITINNAKDARKFDDANHGLSHCMKAVDFIVELSDRYLFIEFKDPQHPMSRQADQQRFIQELQSGQLDEELKYKYRDSFLYEWASGRADKPIHYLVLVALDSLTGGDLSARTNALKQKLPFPGASTWHRQIVQDCSVFNISLWNQHLPDFPVNRLTPLTPVSVTVS